CAASRVVEIETLAPLDLAAFL
uniref:Uncharacterized protein n=1 Tax=Panagrolaimus sp. ES5 TaxID=591445 RepID=A0AC34GLJ2_9BILA